MKREELRREIERLKSIYYNAPPAFWMQLSAELSKAYLSRQAEDFRELVDEVLRLSPFAPNLEAFARASAALDRRRREELDARARERSAPAFASPADADLVRRATEDLAAMPQAELDRIHAEAERRLAPTWPESTRGTKQYVMARTSMLVCVRYDELAAEAAAPGSGKGDPNG